MLGVSSYSQAYIDACRTRVKSEVKAYRTLLKQLKSDAASAKAQAAFEPVFFNNMVLTLDSCFTHRLRGKEGKDGNPCNEVRVVCTSLLENGGKMGADKSIKMDPAKTVLKLAAGAPITVNEADFVRLADAFFAEIERKFT